MTNESQGDMIIIKDVSTYIEDGLLIVKKSGERYINMKPVCLYTEIIKYKVNADGFFYVYKQD